MKAFIIGGVAGGASAAARLRRLREDAQIILLEKGKYVSYANCGLPYYIGGKITHKSALTLQTPESLRQRLAIDVRPEQEAIAIHPEAKTVDIRKAGTGEIYTETYDKLILAPGAEPVHPSIPGADDSRVFTLRTIPDTYRIDTYIKEQHPKRALIIGAGYIGLEMAENLVHAGLDVTVAELSDHVIGPLDKDMAAEVQQYLTQQGVQLMLENGVEAIKPAQEGLRVTLSRGTLETDMILLSIGVRPDSRLAHEAGLAVNQRGAIIVDEAMRTSNADIYAVGDAVQVNNLVTGLPDYIPLAGPANKQGRIAADAIAGKPSRYRGSQGTAILKLFDMTVGATGLNETAAQKAGLAYDMVYFAPNAHAGYYPGALPISIKVLFEKESGRILGAQLVGFDGVDKRLDVLAVAIRAGMTAYDLTGLELAYAPPFSSAKDPVNMAGFMIENLLEGTVKQFHWHQVPELVQEGALLLDVRTPGEYALGHIEGAINIPVDALRERLGELERDMPVYLYCQSGQRSYVASRILAEHGFDAPHLAGGYRVYASAALGVGRPGNCRTCGGV